MVHKLWPGLDALIPRLGQSLAPRSTGLHVSELYGKLHPQPRVPEGKEPPFGPADLNLMAMGGFAIERIMERGLAELMTDHYDKCARPEEMVSSEGIACSPDLFFYGEHDADDPFDIVIGDIKCKWMSCSKLPIEPGEDEFPPSGFDKHFSQIMAYLHVLSEIHDRSYNNGRIIAFFVNGDYMRPFKPKLRAWDFQWSDQEIEENWSALISIARDLE